MSLRAPGAKQSPNYKEVALDWHTPLKLNKRLLRADHHRPRNTAPPGVVRQDRCAVGAGVTGQIYGVAPTKLNAYNASSYPGRTVSAVRQSSIAPAVSPCR